ncbi:Neuropeptides capa receptor [Holothuria leucospilota]|uniref:Neuropeptides capa receptor n=1 Tax=Holothuria leucospilota TaxID=206669 RepID=A0A9Q1BZ36_HOLLE|nr:Neuropeptides capa receptor [Holothuria leucospilota]
MAEMTTQIPTIQSSPAIGFVSDQCGNSTFDIGYNITEILSSYGHFSILFDIVILLIALVGLLANSCFLFVVWRIRAMRTNLNQYLAALAAVDISIFVFGLTDRYFNYFPPITLDVHPPTLGLVSCPFSLLVEVTHYSSLMLITLISLDRYQAICKPLSHRTVVSGKRTKRHIKGALSLALCTALLLIPYRGISKPACIEYPPDGQYNYSPHVILCYSDSKLVVSISQVVQLLPFYMALFVNIFFHIYNAYLVIRWKREHTIVMGTIIRRGSRDDENAMTSSSTSGVAFCSNKKMVSSVYSISSAVAHEESKPKGKFFSKYSRKYKVSIGGKRLGKKSRENQTNVSKMLLINGFAYFLCYSPINFYTTLSFILRLFDKDLVPSYAIYTIFQILFYANSAINPFIYGVTNASYRVAFKRVLILWRQK